MKRTIENGVTVLTADEGMRLTNGDSFVTTVRLGVNASVEIWHEITEAEAEQRQAEAEADEDLTDTEALAIIMGGEPSA